MSLIYTGASPVHAESRFHIVRYSYARRGFGKHFGGRDRTQSSNLPTGYYGPGSLLSVFARVLRVIGAPNHILHAAGAATPRFILRWLMARMFAPIAQ